MVDLVHGCWFHSGFNWRRFWTSPRVVSHIFELPLQKGGLYLFEQFPNMFQVICSKRSILLGGGVGFAEGLKRTPPGVLRRDLDASRLRLLPAGHGSRGVAHHCRHPAALGQAQWSRRAARRRNETARKKTQVSVLGSIYQRVTHFGYLFLTHSQIR